MHPTTLVVVTVLLGLMLARASVLSGGNQQQQQQVIDDYTMISPLHGEFVVLVDGRVDGPRAVHTNRHTILTVTGVDRASIEREYPGALVSEQKQVRAETIWNLDRLDERELRQTDDNWSGPPNGGSSIRIYIVDSGIDGGHPDFEGRVVNEWAVPGSDFRDRCGHGTHVASTAGGDRYGVARGADLRAVKVLSESGCRGTLSSLASGLSHILSTAGGHRSIINLSLGFTGFDSIINSLIQSLLSAGHVVVAAAGNDEDDACSHYPSAYSGVLSLAASDQRDSAATFSNYGVCVDCYAPGVAVRAAEAETPGTVELSGTSMSSPHAAGVAALIWQSDLVLSGSDVVTRLLQSATRGAVTGRSGSPDLLLYWTAGPQSSPTTSSPRPPSNSAVIGLPCVVLIIAVASLIV